MAHKLYLKRSFQRVFLRHPLIELQHAVQTLLSTWNLPLTSAGCLSCLIYSFSVAVVEVEVGGTAVDIDASGLWATDRGLGNRQTEPSHCWCFCPELNRGKNVVLCLPASSLHVLQLKYTLKQSSPLLTSINNQSFCVLSSSLQPK